MPGLKEKHKQDISFILSKRHANGADLWAAENNNIGKGSPFSTRDAALILTELGYDKEDGIIQDIAALIFEHQQADGRFRIYSSGGIYPCQTIGCLRVLCYLGYSGDERLQKTFEHLKATQQPDGGWKCNKFSFGHGPETNHSNPGPTLEALDAFRFTDLGENKPYIEKAVEFLLWHWEVKTPVGPCLFGMGTLFHKTEFPFFRYNLFYYTYVLSFFETARTDNRFMEAYKILESKVDEGLLVVENPSRQLAEMDFCFKGRGSEAATKRFTEIKHNIA